MAEPKTLSYADVPDENKGDKHIAFQTIIHIVCILLSGFPYRIHRMLDTFAVYIGIGLR